MHAPDLLIRHERKQAQIAGVIADVQVFLAAKADERRNAAFHPQPGNDERLIVPNGFDHFALVSRKIDGLGKRARTHETAEREAPENEHAQRIEQQKDCQQDERVHVRASVGTLTRARISRTKSAPVICWCMPRRMMRCASTGTASVLTSSGMT